MAGSCRSWGFCSITTMYFMYGRGMDGGAYKIFNLAGEQKHRSNGSTSLEIVHCGGDGEV